MRASIFFSRVAGAGASEASTLLPVTLPSATTHTPTITAARRRASLPTLPRGVRDTGWPRSPSPLLNHIPQHSLREGPLLGGLVDGCSPVEFSVADWRRCCRTLDRLEPRAKTARGQGTVTYRNRHVTC